MRLNEIPTPALILDRQKLKANIDRMTGHIASHGVKLRPHLKTCKSIDVARIALQDKNVSMTLITDSLSVARLLAEQAAGHATRLKVMVEVDCGEHRTGVLPHDPVLVEIAQCLHESDKVVFAGVFTHAGHSYQCRSLAEIKRVAEDERTAVVSAAETLRSRGIPCDNV